MKGLKFVAKKSCSVVKLQLFEVKELDVCGSLILSI